MRILLLLFCFCNIALGQTDTTTNSKMTPTIVYGSDTCHYCIETKDYLQENKIVFIYYDIDKNELKLQEMLFKMRSAGLSPANVQLPVIDKAGKVFMNDPKDFKLFLKRLTLTSKL